MNHNWDKFVQATKSRQPVGFLVEAVKKITSAKGRALDLGCGAGVDVEYLARNGFEVEAIDNNQKSIKQTKELCKELNVKIIQDDVAGFKIQPDFYQLILCWNTLPFLNKSDAGLVLKAIQRGLINDGLFVFGLFGVEDEWNNEEHPGMSFWTIEEVKNVLSDMEFLKILEIKERKPGATGEIKFWHQIQGIAQRRAR